MELLELQARARAIRSQLALEPVAKIELEDSDNELIDESLAIKPPQSSGSQRPPSNERNSTAGHETDKKIPRTDIEELVEISDNSARPIRLKRNFRKRQSGEKNAQQQEQKLNEEIKKEVLSERCSSPDNDIIPIIREPEIVLCISSDDSGSEIDRASYLKMPLVPKENRTPTDDELFLQRVKCNAITRSKTVDSIELTVNKEGLSAVCVAQMRNIKTVDAMNDDTKQTIVRELPEDGEILDEDELEPPISESVNIDVSTEPAATQELSPSFSSNSPSDSNRSLENSLNGQNSKTSTRSENMSKNEEGTTEEQLMYDEEDNDIIDLDKDEDLDFEISNNDTMCEPLTIEQNTNSDSNVAQNDVSILSTRVNKLIIIVEILTQGRLVGHKMATRP